jgi:7,8-dihydro-6-hydroxymethylpterin-pyrophosphokinase
MHEHPPVEIENHYVNLAAIHHIKASSPASRQTPIGEQQQLPFTNEQRQSRTDLSLTHVCYKGPKADPGGHPREVCAWQFGSCIPRVT